MGNRRFVLLALAVSLVLNLLLLSNATAGPTGQFQVIGGKVYDPDGKLYVAAGINIDSESAKSGGSTVANSVRSLFPGINFVRINVGSNGSGYSTTPAALSSFITALTNNKIVCEIEFHPWPLINEPPPAGETAWYASMASYYKNNNYVWFGSMNEPQGGNIPGISQEHVAVYKAIRGAGNESMILFEAGVGSGDPNQTGSAVLTSSSYTSMHRVGWDMHFYGWVNNFSTNVSQLQSLYLGNTTNTGIYSLRVLRSADGQMPIFNAEFGPSTSGGWDANWSQVTDTIVNFGVANGYSSGYAAFNWDVPDLNILQSGGILRSPWGTTIRSAIGSTISWLASQNGTMNLVANPGFESGLTSWNNEGSGSVISTNCHSGTRCLSTSANSGGASQRLNFTIGRTYTLKGWGKLSSTNTAYLVIKAYDSNWRTLAESALTFTTTSYSQKTTSLKVPSGTAYLQVQTWGPTSGYLYVDDIEVNDTTNLVANPGFESGLTSWNNESSGSVIGTNCHSGTRCLSTSANSGGASQLLNFTIGRTYTLKGWGKVSNANKAGYLTIKAFDSNWMDISGSELTFTTTSYTQKTTTFTVPSKTAHVQVVTWGPSLGYLYVDDIEVN